MSIKNSTGIEPATYRFVAQHLNHCATAVPLLIRAYIKLMTKHLYPGVSNDYQLH